MQWFLKMFSDDEQTMSLGKTTQLELPQKPMKLDKTE